MDREERMWMDAWYYRISFNMGSVQENLTPIRDFDVELNKKIEKLFGEMHKDLENFGNKYSAIYSNKKRYQNVYTGYKITPKSGQLSYKSILSQLDGLKDDLALLGKVDDEGYTNAISHLNQIVNLVNDCEKKHPETKKEENLILDERIF